MPRTLGFKQNFVLVYMQACLSDQRAETVVSYFTRDVSVVPKGKEMKAYIIKYRILSTLSTFPYVQTKIWKQSFYAN